MPGPPHALRRHQFLPSPDFTQAVCLWEPPPIEELRAYIDLSLEPASTQTYFRVYEKRAVGPPVAFLGGSRGSRSSRGRRPHPLANTDLATMMLAERLAQDLTHQAEPTRAERTSA
jgi:hypothetical protein